jgi:hypothetical protein
MSMADRNRTGDAMRPHGHQVNTTLLSLLSQPGLLPPEVVEGRSIALLELRDKKIGVFSILRRADDEYLLACIDSFPFSALAEEPGRLEDLALLVSRQSLAINAADESKHLLHSRARRCFESSELSPLETSTASKVRATLPEDADRRFARMTDHVKYTEKPRGSFGEFLKIYSSTKDPVRKLFAFECLRFCFELSKILPDGWRIEFKKGTNITIQVYPDWISPEIKEDTTVGGFLLQLKAGGTRPGHVWYRIPKHVQNLPDTSAKKFVFTVKQGMEDSLKQGGIKAKLDMASTTEYILFLLGRCSQSLESRKLVQHSFSYPDPFAKK